MSAEAKAKLQAEMDGARNDAYVQFVGQFLLQHLDANPADAAKILTADKTIAKSLDAMRSAAEKKKKGNMAMLTPNEGFAIVLKYFGIERAPAVPTAPATIPAAVAAPVAAPATAAADFDIKLEDFGL